MKAGPALAETYRARRIHTLGFLGIHDGRGANQVFLDLWVNENELLHVVWVSTKDDPGALVHPPPDEA